MLLMLPDQTLAAEDLKTLKNVGGQVILDKNTSLDAITYTLNKADADLYSVEQTFNTAAATAATTFSSRHYGDGLLDSNLIEEHNLPSHFFNNVVTGINGDTGIYTIKLRQKVNIFAYYVNYADSKKMKVTFLANGVGAGHLFSSSRVTQDLLQAVTADTIVIDTSYGNLKMIAEIDFFYEPVPEYKAATDINIDVGETYAKITYSAPDVPNHVATEILFDGNLNNLEPNTKYSATIRSTYDDGKFVDVAVEFETLKDTTPPSNPDGFVAAIKNKKDVELTFALPSNKDFSHVQIYKDNKLIKDNYKDTSFIDTDTAFNTNYTYKVISVDAAGNKSSGVSATIKTPPDAPKDVQNLSATATSNKVSLKWKNTTHEKFEIVTIYRKQDTVMAKAKALFNVNGDTPIFTTNGTEFEDLTVTPDTKYTYRITTTIAGVESVGVTVDVKTKAVTVGETTVKPQENGDYVVTWSSPTTGKMQINVGGTKYAVVPAANKTFTVPAADVKFDLLGVADIQLIPLNDAGEPVGPSTKPGGGGLGSIIGGGEGIFDAPDLVKAAASLFALVGGFILLGLAFRVVPMLVKTIRNALISGGAKR